MRPDELLVRVAGPRVARDLLWGPGRRGRAAAVADVAQKLGLTTEALAELAWNRAAWAPRRGAPTSRDEFLADRIREAGVTLDDVLAEVGPPPPQGDTSADHGPTTDHGT